MRPLESMRLRMQPLKLYNLTKSGSLVDAELSACAEVLNLAYDRLLEMERELYLSSAQSWGLEAKCAAMGIADGGNLRRAAGLELLREGTGQCTRKDFVRLADALGISGRLYECFEQKQTIFCPDTPPADRAFIQKILRRMLPAQLEAVLDLRGSAAAWEIWDSQNASWSALDAKDKTWGEMEQNVISF